jgi:hypothetical protein
MPERPRARCCVFQSMSSCPCRPVSLFFRPLPTPPMSDTYGDQLRSIASSLQGAGFSRSVRGEGGGRFVYAEHADRAIELSWDGAGFLVELFEQPSEASVRDYQKDTPEHAAEQAVEWLSRDENAA